MKKSSRVIETVMGVIIFSISIYAFTLSIKANQMAIDKMTKEK